MLNNIKIELFDSLLMKEFIFNILRVSVCISEWGLGIEWNSWFFAMATFLTFEPSFQSS